jgi:UDP-N-acetylmuramoyl-tripeptide--D-alanyl-D-alanine ligase
MRLALGEVAQAIGAREAPPERHATGFSVDSRTLEPGDLFFALRGVNHDGHDFALQAFEKGAVAAVVERPVAGGGPLLRVADTYRALKDLAAYARRRWTGTMIGVTGSAGKTTTKEAIAHLLGTRLAVGKSEGNYNNHVGVPLSILRLPGEGRAAVIEIAMNHAGEIAELAAIARPEIGVVTNVGHAHVEFFDSIEGIARAKRELIEALPADGTAVLNADDPRVLAFREVHPGPVMTFGFSEGADVRAECLEQLETGSRFRLAGDGWLETPLEGRHAIRNLLAALAVARLFGLGVQELAEAVRSFEAGAMRGRPLSRNGVTILDDCYNANPEAVCAMLDTLREKPGRRKVALLGQMLELGRHSEALHRQVGRYAAESGIDLLIGVKGDARHLVEAAVEAGLPPGAAHFCEEPEAAGELLRRLARPGDVILFKASRGTGIEKALQRFLG